jgi:hypothetical protein
MNLRLPLALCACLSLACGGWSARSGDDATATAPATRGPTSKAAASVASAQTLPLGSASTGLRNAGRSAPPSEGGDVGKAGKSGKAGKAGKAGGAPGGAAGGGTKKVSAAFNNAYVLARTEDGALHSLHSASGEVLYRRQAANGSVSEARFGSSRAPALATDGKDTVMVVWTDERVMAAISSDGGQSFAAPLVVSATRGQNPSAHLWREGGELKGAIVWHEDLGGGGGASGGRQESPKGVFGTVLSGNRFSKAQRLDSSSHEAAFATVHGSDQGSVVLWRERQSARGERSIVMAPISQGRFGSGRSLLSGGLDPSVCVDGKGAIHVGYQNDLKETWYIRSNDGGSSFSDPLLLDYAGLFVRVACNEAGQVALAWEHFTDPQASFADDTGKTLGLASSNDGGRTWTVHDPTHGERNLALTTCALDDKGRMDILYVRGGGELEVQTIQLGG